MGKKISVDSSTMMNKVYEIIEAKKIFNIHYKKISISEIREKAIESNIKVRKFNQKFDLSIKNS